MAKAKTLPAQILQVVQTTNADIPQTKIKTIAAKYAPYMQQVNDIAHDVAKLQKGNSEHVEQAKRARIDLGKICSAVEQRKKQDKAGLLLEANYYQALFNTVNGAARIVQDEAKEIEKFAELQAKRIAQELQEKRISQVTKYGVDGQYIDVGTMSEEVWQNFLLGTKTAWKQKQQAQEKAKQDEIDRLKKAEQEKKQLQLKLKKQQEQAAITSEKLQDLKSVGVEMTFANVAQMSEQDYKTLYSNSKKAHNARIKKQQQQQEAQQREQQQAQQQREQLIQKRTKQVQALGDFSNIHGMLMHDTLDIKFFEADLVAAQKVFNDLLQKAKHTIQQAQQQQQQQQKRAKQLQALGFIADTDAWLHMKANYRIFDVQLYKMVEQQWSEVLQDFDASVKIQQQLQIQQQAKALELEQQRKAQTQPDKQKLQAFISALISTPSPQLKTKAAQNIMADINTMLIKMETFVNGKLEKL